MLKNRAIQVKMVKNAKDETVVVDSGELFYKKANLIGCHLRNTVVSIGKTVLLYVAADTIRQIAVNKTS